MLLLYAVRLVRTGISRAYGASFKRIVTRNESPPRAAIIGLMLAILLQSSAAVTILVSEFAAVGAIGLAGGIAVVIGADLGSALIVKVLSLRVDWLSPILLAVGGALFLKTQAKVSVQSGRILIGLGLILLALQLLRQTVEPVQQGAYFPAIAAYLESDPITAFLVGAILALIMHSSVAVILMCVTLLAISAFPFSVGLSLALGANLGSALIPIWLTRGKDIEIRRIPLANLIIRGSFAILALLLWFRLPTDQILVQIEPSERLVLLHIVFNALLFLFLPFVGPFARGLMKLFPPKVAGDSVTNSLLDWTVLDENSLDTPALALTCVRREVLRMMQVAEVMMTRVITHLEDGNLEAIAETKDLDLKLNDCLTGIRQYVIDMHDQALTKSQKREARRLTEAAINVETAGDIVSRRLVPLTILKAKSGIRFSEEGWAELVEVHEQVVAITKLASNVLLSEDVDAARVLVEEKSDLAKRERASRKKHLKRIQKGTELSLESSDLHLETLRAFREFGSQLSSVAYPILSREGHLLDSRLVARDEN